jgi:hypothetical protein
MATASDIKVLLDETLRDVVDMGNWILTCALA